MIDIKPISLDDLIPDKNVQQQVWERIITASGLPPSALGLNWATTPILQRVQRELLEAEGD